MTLAAQRIQQPLSPGLLGQGPPLAGPSFAPPPPHYGALPGQAPHPPPGPPESYPPYPSTPYGYPLQQSYDGYGQSLNPPYPGQPAGNPLANQHLPCAFPTAVADMSAMTATGSTLQQQHPQAMYGQQSDGAHMSQLRPIFPPSHPPNAYQQNASSAQNYTMSGDVNNFAFSQPYASMPAGGSFYS